MWFKCVENKRPCGAGGEALDLKKTNLLVLSELSLDGHRDLVILQFFAI